MKWVIIAAFLATSALSKTFLIETDDGGEDGLSRQAALEDTGADVGVEVSRRQAIQEPGALEYGEDYHNSGLPCNAAQGFDPLACLDAAGQLPQTTTSLSAQIPGYVIFN